MLVETDAFKTISEGLKDLEAYVEKPTLADVLRQAAGTGVQQLHGGYYRQESMCAWSAVASVLKNQ